MDPITAAAFAAGGHVVHRFGREASPIAGNLIIERARRRTMLDVLGRLPQDYEFSEWRADGSGWSVRPPRPRDVAVVHDDRSLR